MSEGTTPLTVDIEERPAPPASPAAPARQAPPKKSWREKRRERRRRRLWLEEFLGWILVPTILISGYLFIDMMLNAVGTSPSALIQGLTTLRSNF